MASKQNSEDEAVSRIESCLDRVESRMDRVESMVSSGDEESDEVEDLRLALNGLRREHRELKEKVEERVLDYLEEEKGVMEDLDRKIDGVGALMQEVNANRARLRDLESEVEGKADTEDLEAKVGAVEEESEREDRELIERVRRLETRMDLMAERMD